MSHGHTHGRQENDNQDDDGFELPHLDPPELNDLHITRYQKCLHKSPDITVTRRNGWPYKQDKIDYNPSFDEDWSDFDA
jgi:hypothetical protein